jgi:hypothetical protein
VLASAESRSNTAVAARLGISRVTVIEWRARDLEEALGIYRDLGNRGWRSSYRSTSLAMLALAFLSIAAATEHASRPPQDQIPLTRNEIAALFSTLIINPANDARYRLRWSTWRRRRQHRAKTCHYQRQARQP